MSAFVRALSVSSLALAVLGAAACAGNGGEAPAANNDAKSGAAAPAKSEAGAAIAGKPVEGEGKVGVAPGGESDTQEYKLQIEPAAATVGAESKVSIRVVPQGVWHMNLEYPTKLEITAPAGTTVAKPKLAKADAIQLDEKGCEFAVAFTPAEAGTKTFTGEFKFAICQDEACVPKTETLNFEVAVNE